MEKVLLKDLPDILRLYEKAKTTEGCVWDEDYPNEVILRQDIEDERMYGFRDGEGCFFATIVRDEDDTVSTLPFWSAELEPTAELARLAVHPAYQNQGMARKLITDFRDILKAQGFGGIHYLVSVSNERALRSYQKLGYTKVGETDLFESHYDCYESAL